MALVVERRKTHILDLQVHRELTSLRRLVAIRTADQLETVAHAAVEFIERSVLAPHFCYGGRETALDKRPVQPAHLGDSGIVGRLLLGLAGAGDTALASDRHIERLLSYIGFLDSRVLVRTHVIVVVQERIVMLRQTGLGCVLPCFGCG